MNPLGLASIPSEVLGALRVLPRMARRLDAVARYTEHLPGILDSTESMKGDTTSLAELSAHMATVADAMGVLVGMDERMATIESAMPVLVTVQQHLNQLPDTIDDLQSGIDRLCGLMERLLLSVDGLDGDVNSLQHSIEPLGRIADRLPRGSRRAAD